ncbi:A/G-specific adenine glycosylase [Acetobacteraceae bacterium KSS8]|uniref:Adenine DNA glycosylase n=1 Tax=Endosaccharibacter trunci TaxID=2812733 RepID=A0ABT1W649_9PROT|nr:A/G-specific adenine glycosylase [Acetobacteraceae bacterium KSS8]
MPPEPPVAAPEAADLLRWYDRHRRQLPWRAETGVLPDPYHVWLSEIMLQQTTVAAVGPYFRRFLDLFPTVEALAEAPSEQVMSAWAGLGYYARARNLHACAKAVSALGGFPRTIEGLRALPGIGAYTAPAIAAIAFGVPAVPVDGNVERVCARLFAIDTPLPAARPLLARAAAALGADPQARARPSDFAQALFDLGATICTPRNPACALCPWREPCLGRQGGAPERLPVKVARKDRPERYGISFRLEDGQGRLLLQTRPPRGLLGGMSELPGTPWRTEPWSEADALPHAPISADWRATGSVRHIFTHFGLTLAVWSARRDRIPAEALENRFLRAPDALGKEPLPTLMRKAIAAGGGG